MSYAHALSATGLYNWAARSVAELSLRRAEINALNVFPVPDADTGSNMAHTMEAALAQADRGGDVAQALAVGAVRGARGNSGMVLSQVMAGLANATQDSVVTAQVLADSLQRAVALVDRAIAEPVEGTIITVLRAAAAAATAAVADGDDLHPMLRRVAHSARRALEETPSQLQVLRDAGVVDAGGAGLVILLECMLAELEGAEMPGGVPVPGVTTELEVVFFFRGDVAALEQQLAPLGNSLVVARADETSASLHLHTRCAGQVIELAFASGEVTGLHLEALPPAVAPAPGSAPAAGARVPDQHILYAVVPEGPVAEIFTSAGARTIPPEETAELQPLAGDIVLANGFGLAGDAARVVPGDSLVAGIAAASVYDAAQDVETNLVTMRDAVRSMRVIRPAGADSGSIIAAARELLRAGGEQVTVLSPQALDREVLEAELGVEVMVLTAPGVMPEVGVE